MAKARPEREQVEQMLLSGKKRYMHEIAAEAGLIEALGYDKAVEYVKQVKKSLKKKGIEIPPFRSISSYTGDEARLEDLETLFELRKGKRLAETTAYTMLFLNCYYRLRAQDYNIHIDAVKDTYRKNEQLKKPFTMAVAIEICEQALAKYTESIDESRNRHARKKGYPGAGLHYTDAAFIRRLGVTDDEMPFLKHIHSERTTQTP